jgi:hypothetical protein
MAPTIVWIVFAASFVQEAGALKTKWGETQLGGEEGALGQKDLVFVHVPLNLGNPLVEAAVMGSQSRSKHKADPGADRVAGGHAGWKMLNEMAQPHATIWGPMHPDLQEESDYGCPLFETPQQHWPGDKARTYFSNKTVFGMLRDPYDRWVSAFRGFLSIVPNAHPQAKGWDFEPDDMTCDINTWTQMMLAAPTLWPKAVACKLQPQAAFFEGPHRITMPVDLRAFPENANTLLKAHGYDNINMDPTRMTHSTGCDNTWAGDLNNASKTLIHNYYRRDFDLVCQRLGHCSHNENVCATGVPGACPAKLFSWKFENKVYRRLQ